MEHREAVEMMASERYLLGEMDDAQRDAFEAHFFSCAECAADVREGAVMRDGVHAGLTRSAASTRGWRPAIVIPWAAAATLAIAAGYQSFRTPTAGSLAAGSAAAGALATGPLPLAPITLRASTRGQEARVVPGPGGIVTLALDLGGERFD